MTCTHYPEGQGSGACFDPARIADVVEEGDGFWRTCSGCAESNEGYLSSELYPHSPVFGCQLGGGCGDCGGIGATWDDTDYAEMATWMAELARDEANVTEVLNKHLRVCGDIILGIRDAAYEIALLEPASGIAAATAGETAKTGSTVGKSPTVEDGDAQGPSA